MKVLFLSSEIIPFASTGGLGDVCTALPKALARQGVETVRMMPLYEQIDRTRFNLEKCDIELHIPLGRAWYHGSVWMQQFENVKTYFIHSPEFFDRPSVYGLDDHGYADNFERFLFFQKAVVQLIDDWELKPDIVHCNDWHSALVPMLLYHGIDGTFRNGKEKTLMTVHNLLHQGWAQEEKFYMTNLPDSCYTMHTLEFYGEINPLKGGLVSASAINTVSPAYAKEIQTPKFGFKLDGVLRERKDVLHGILNGIDHARWNPETDRYLPAHYSAENLAGKKICKHTLQEMAGFAPDPDTPLIGVISRLVPQKGIGMLADIMERLIETGMQLVILGMGNKVDEEICRGWAERWPKQVCAWIEFSNEKAHQVEAGSDIFLMPSEFEPCGQNQLYSMRYGTIPVVHGVGGLEDSVANVTKRGGTGFKYHKHTPAALLQSIQRAIELYNNKIVWNTIVKRAMNKDFSVKHMAKDYIKLYRKILSKNETVDRKAN